MPVSVDDIEALLPQTQCGECGFAGCRPYAEALAAGHAIDRCPPGGVTTLKALGNLLSVDASPFIKTVQAKTRPPAVAFIREQDCIGCTKCLPACPVDAIIGSGKLLHTVIATECTGCGLCVEPCPVDCIELLPLEAPNYDKDKARARYQAAKLRQERRAAEQEQAYREKMKALARLQVKPHE